MKSYGGDINQMLAEQAMSAVPDTTRRRPPESSSPATAPPIQPAGRTFPRRGESPRRAQQSAHTISNPASSLASGARSTTDRTNLHGTPGVSSSAERGGGVVDRVQEEEAVEEFYGQLWVVPSAPKPRVPVAAAAGRGALFWVRKDLVRAKTFGIEDCYRVSRFDRIEAPPVRFSYSRDLWVWKNRRETYADILKMAEGDQGRWVWQPPQQRPPRPQPRAPQQGYHNQRGPPPLQPPGQQQRRGGGNQGGGRGRYQQQQAAEQTQGTVDPIPPPPPSRPPIQEKKKPLGSQKQSNNEETTQWLNFKNCGVVKVITGDVSIAEMEKELSDIFCREWPWQIRELDKGNFLVRFPPHKKVSDIKNLPSFNLRKEGVRVEVLEWVGELDPFEELQEVWVEVSGIPPKWCAWSVFAQVTSSFGMMTDVEWPSLFKSFYEKVRIKVACRDPAKIPMQRIFEMDKKLYNVYFYVEDFEQAVGDNKDTNDDDQDGNDGDADEEFDGLDELSGGNPMETDNSNNQEGDKGGSKSTQGTAAPSKGSKTVGLQPDMEHAVEIFLTGAHLFQKEQETVTTILVEEQAGKEMGYKAGEVNNQKEEDTWMNHSMETGDCIVNQEEGSQQSRWMDFMMQNQGDNSISRCAQLLRSMEMIQSDTESEAEEENKHHLTKEMIEQMSAKRNLLEELSKCAEDEEKPKETKKQKKQQMWGPILPCRKSSRNVEDGRTVMEKAQSNIKHKNLEKPVKHGVSPFMKGILWATTAAKMGGNNPSTCAGNLEFKCSTENTCFLMGHKWTRIQELELGIARTLRRWRLLIKAENVEKMDEIAGKWQKQAMEKSVIYDREWWVEHQSVRPRAQIESSFASNVVLMSQCRKCESDCTAGCGRELCFDEQPRAA
ncbi:hypothetical protein EJB05_00274, partial [Eragrostis curvula]